MKNHIEMRPSCECDFSILTSESVLLLVAVSTRICSYQKMMFRITNTDPTTERYHKPGPQAQPPAWAAMQDLQQRSRPRKSAKTKARGTCSPPCSWRWMTR